MANMRLHKWIATQGLASRRMAENWIRFGRVEVNGRVEKELGRQIDPAKDKVRVDGILLADKAPGLVYWLFHKPDATMTTKKDPEGRLTIYQVPSVAKLSVPVNAAGRLDYRTEGVLLLSNDGDLLHRLMHPKFHVPRTYDVLLPQKLTETVLKRFASGITLSDGKVGPVDIRAHGTKNMGKTRGYWYRVVVHEGRNRLVRRLFEKVGVRIVRLVRVAYGPIRLPESSVPGSLIPLTADQISALKRATEKVAEEPRPVARRYAAKVIKRTNFRRDSQGSI
jgi:23S rRNA pseudouridine2605 synthase